MTSSQLATPAAEEQRIRGILLGTAVGDSLGLPAERMSRRRLQRRWRGRWKHRFFFGKGMVSDDTEHTLFLTDALVEQPQKPEEFQKALARKLRWWLLCLPSGIGFATLRSILKLWLGWSPTSSGVVSAGNGPAMRSAVLGAFFTKQPVQLKAYVGASTALNHRDPRASVGALAVAHCVAWTLDRTNPTPGDVEQLFDSLKGLAVPEDQEWREAIDQMINAYERQDAVDTYIEALGLQEGISGYIYHTVPVAIYAWLRHYGNFRLSLEAVLAAGGDTDTVGAITGALAGATVGEKGIPQEWLQGIMDWPISVDRLKQAADHLGPLTHKPATLTDRFGFWPKLLARNLVFFLIVLVHIIRRLGPPY